MKGVKGYLNEMGGESVKGLVGYWNEEGGE